MSSLHGGDSVDIDAYIAELAQSKLAKGSDNLPIKFVGEVQLHHGHIQRAEWGILSWSHRNAGLGKGGLWEPRPLLKVMVQLIDGVEVAADVDTRFCYST
jgi:hypothetical protein